MAEIKVLVTVPAYTTERVEHIICELCGAKSHDDSDWQGDSHKLDEVKVEHNRGENYPEFMSTVTVKLDICPACFSTKLLPWFESQGGKPRKIVAEC